MLIFVKQDISSTACISYSPHNIKEAIISYEVYVKEHKLRISAWSPILHDKWIKMKHHIGLVAEQSWSSWCGQKYSNDYFWGWWLGYHGMVVCAGGWETRRNIWLPHGKGNDSLCTVYQRHSSSWRMEERVSVSLYDRYRKRSFAWQEKNNTVRVYTCR